MTYQTSNSAAKAYRYLQRAKSDLFRYYNEEKEKAMYEVILRLLKKAVHFSLPDDGKILNDGLLGLKGVEAKLPYPIITLEFDAVYNEGNVKALVLAAEGDAVKDSVVLDDPEDCFVTFLLFSIPVLGPTWFLNPMLFKITHAWESSNTKAPFNALIFEIFPTVIKEKVREDPDALKKFEDTTAWGSTAVLELCEALSCSNVEVGTLQSASPKNAKRIKQGKLPLLETKTLVINTRRQAGTGQGGGGSSISPRQHLRRGHIRFLQSDRFKNKQGQKIWVNSTVVGGEGRINKTYEVR